MDKVKTLLENHKYFQGTEDSESLLEIIKCNNDTIVVECNNEYEFEDKVNWKSLESLGKKILKVYPKLKSFWVGDVCIYPKEEI